ncbi:MAG: protein jag, partial [Candidatus Binatia bacterium]
PTPRPAPAPQAAPRPELPLDPATLERGRVALAEIVRLSAVEAQVAIADDADGPRLVIDGDPNGILIGRRGQTLDALEYLINRIVAQDEDAPSRLIVDAQGYRARRRQSLEEMARRLAERARTRGKPVTLSPMSPRDRRVVHLVLQGDPTLKTHSAGTGYYRKLVIVPAGAPRRTQRPRAPEAPE